MRFLIDTWGWYVLGNARDPQHARVKAFYQRARRAGALIYTSDYILDETITLLFRRIPPFVARAFVLGLLEAIAQGFLRLEEISADRFGQAWELRQRYHEKPMVSFTDLTSFVVMRDMGLSHVLTDDAHFSQIGMGFRILPGRSVKPHRRR